jgi:metallo-beta-lactamase class B
MRRLLLLGLVASLTGAAAPSGALAEAARPAAAPAGSPASWSTPTPPFRIAGPIHYVGTEGIASYLINSGDGLILLDGGLAETVPANAHWDHAAGLAALKRDTGAEFASSAGDREAYETGIPPSDVSYGVMPFAPVKVDRVVVDGQPIRLGNVAMTPVITPGHTPGCTSWTMRVDDGGRALDVMFPCSITVAGNKLVRNEGYPGIVADFQRTFERMRGLRADIVLPAHPELADVLGRARRQAAGAKRAFLAPDLLPRLVSEAQTAFEAELEKQGG